MKRASYFSVLFNLLDLHSLLLPTKEVSQNDFYSQDLLKIHLLEVQLGKMILESVNTDCLQLV